MVETTYCDRCDMRFAITVPPSKRVTLSRCPEPGCRLKSRSHRFWHGARFQYEEGIAPIHIGVLPEDMASNG